MKRFKKILAVLSDEVPTTAAFEWLSCLATQAEAEGVDLLPASRSALVEYPSVGDEGTGEDGPLAEIRQAAESALVGHPVKVLEPAEDGLRATLGHLATGVYDLVVVPVEGAATRSMAERLARKSPVGVLVLPEVAPVPPRRIVASIDFSDLSPLTLDWAEAFGTLHADGAELEAVHVLDLTLRTRATMVRDAERLREDIRGAADWQMKSFVEEHARDAGRWSHKLVEGQLPGIDLAARVEREADLLVIGCNGRNALSIALLGSNAAEVIRHSARPVLVVKQKNQNLGFLRDLIGWEA
ncbi:MAG: universal stress protein [Verrucomicrobiota bacterium]